MIEFINLIDDAFLKICYLKFQFVNLKLRPSKTGHFIVRTNFYAIKNEN